MVTWMIVIAFPARCQRGQALVESLLVLGVLASLVIGATWLGRLQDLSLQLAHASRHAAFAQAHQDAPAAFLDATTSDHFAAAGHAWATRTGVLPSAPPVTTLDSLAIEPSPAPGDPLVAGPHWRTELALGDPHVWRATTSVRTAGGDETTGALHDFDAVGPVLRRHTAILRGSGAAASDVAVQQRLGSSAHAWKDLALSSQQHGEQALQRLQGLDAAWRRALPTWDWVSDWAGEIPRSHLRPAGAP